MDGDIDIPDPRSLEGRTPQCLQLLPDDAESGEDNGLSSDESQSGTRGRSGHRDAGRQEDRVRMEVEEGEEDDCSLTANYHGIKEGSQERSKIGCTDHNSGVASQAGQWFQSCG
jgi:hypothetical protein